MTALLLEDDHAYADLRTYVTRARALDADGAVRLQALGTVLAAYVGVLPGRGLLGEGVVLGLRTVRLREPADSDVTVPLSAVADRLARRGQGALELPPATVQTAWAAMTPPRAGWEPVGRLTGEALVEVARAGIAEVSRGAGAGAGAHAVADLRHRVWGRLTPTVPPVPAGAAFGAYALGFLETADGADGVRGAGGADAGCQVVAHGRWTRLSSPRGHVLVR